jgi:RNA polymerase sigma-70 factor (ECF subfamily)
VSAELDDEVLQRFIVAFESADIAGLAALLRHDVEVEMPPIPTWFAGRDAVVEFLATRAVAAYFPDDDGRFTAHSIQVLEMSDGAITHIYAFLDTDMFAAFGLPLMWA